MDEDEDFLATTRNFVCSDELCDEFLDRKGYSTTDDVGG